MRRLRMTPALRALRRETRLSAEQLICPVFVAEDARAAGPVAAMPGIERHTLDSLERHVESAVEAGIRSVILFGIPSKKDARASGAFAADGVIPRAIERVVRVSPDVAILTDVCLCQYTDHGHCGLLNEPGCAVRGESRGSAGDFLDHDATLEVLGRTAVAHAQAGAQIVAPSGMMDGMVRGIRGALDAAGFHNVAILSYAAKYASAFYGPFREAADSAPQFGDRRGYQMDPANGREALAEVELDIAEGADMVMVKPALPYLDVIRQVGERFPGHPLAAYQVSGEYSMIKAAGGHGWLDERRVMMESLTSIVRAGADMILTYFAVDAARILRNG